MLGRLLALIRKEFLAVWRDRKSRTVLIVPPLVQLLVFAHAATLDVKNISMGFVNRDVGEQGFELIQRFRGAPVFTHITPLASPSEIEPYIDNQEGMLVVSIDPTFSLNLDKAMATDVQLILDGRKSNAAQIIAGYATSIIDNFSEEVEARVGYPKTDTRLVGRNWFNPNLIYYWFNVPNLSGVLTAFVAMLVTALAVARERELGTFDQLLVSPLSPWEILIGKTVPALVISMVEGTVIILAAIYLFRVPMEGSFSLLYLGMFVFACAIVGIGLFISGLCFTQQQAILGTFVFMSPAVLLSGFATPVENMPQWLQILTYANPLRYYLVIAKGVMLKDMSFSMVFSNVWPLLVISLCTWSAATWFFHRRIG